MEKAILKTLIYADIFDYPLKVYEIHKWLIGRRTTLQQIEKALERLRVKGEAERVKDYYFLTGRKKLVAKRKIATEQSHKFLNKVKVAAGLLKIIPWVELVGVSGGLAMENTTNKDDIDLFIITAKNRLWISRLLILGLLSLSGQRRIVKAKNNDIAGKFCVNMLLEEDQLSQSHKDIYLAHEVLQMKVLWQRDGIYSNYLTDNEWAFKFLPNWISGLDLRFKILDLPAGKASLRIKARKSLIVNHKSFLDYIEILARKFQLMIMKSPQGNERIEDRALYFHPNDVRLQVLKEYKTRIKTF